MIEQEPHHPAGPWRKSPRKLPLRIPVGAHVLSHSDLCAIARHYAGHDDPVMGEELLPLILHHKMLGADHGRIIPSEILAELDPDGTSETGRRVLCKFLENIRKRPQAGYARGGAAKLTKEAAGYRNAIEDGKFCAL